MQTLLILQDLGVAHEVISELIREANLPLEPLWPAPGPVPSPDEVAVIVTVNTPVDERLLTRLPNVRIVAVAFTGYDSVDLEACRQRNIAVCNVPFYATDSVAELTLGLAISLLRDIPAGDRTIRHGGWLLDHPGTELAGKTVGIIGTGAIGLRVAELFRALKCKLIGWSRTQREPFTTLGGTYLTIDEVFSRADIVSLHVPLDAETRGLIGRKELSLMRPGACLINTARGPIVNSAALVDALESGRIRAAIDVFDTEPAPADDALIHAGATVLTPHIAYKTHEALTRRAAITINNIKGFFDGRDLNRVV
jgi:phosphoglycerate dehydrogenase-like enzyme